MIDAACRSSDCNGLCFGNVYIAKELVSFILLHVDYKTTISNCRLVCKQWNDIITDPLFWKHKTALENKKWPSVPRDEHIPWSFYANVYLHNPIGRNLIQNPNGKGIYFLFSAFIVHVCVIIGKCACVSVSFLVFAFKHKQHLANKKQSCYIKISHIPGCFVLLFLTQLVQQTFATFH